MMMMKKKKKMMMMKVMMMMMMMEEKRKRKRETRRACLFSTGYDDVDEETPTPAGMALPAPQNWRRAPKMTPELETPSWWRRSGAYFLTGAGGAGASRCSLAFFAIDSNRLSHSVNRPINRS